MGNFTDPIVGGVGTLIRAAIRSANYVAGVSGWQINRNGSAEFSDATVRGQVIVGALPNAIELLQPPNIPIELVNFYAARGESLTTVQLFRDGTGRYEYLGNLSGGALVIGGVDGAGDVQEMVFLWHQIPRASFAFGESSPLDLYISSQGSATSTFLTDLPLRSSTSGVAETWHNVTGGVGYATNWADVGGSDQAARFRLMPDGTVSLNGDAKTTANVSTPSIIFTLPVGYRPAADEQFPGNVAGSRIAVQASTGRVILVDVAGTVAIPVLGLSHVRFPLASLL